ncbi:MAG TPA: metal transporter, partial [Thermoanaerobaculia bacterium]
DPVRIAQVLVDEAYWAFEADPGTELGHLDRTTLSIPYPWVHGEAHALRVITATGVTFDHEIAVAVASPEPSGRFVGIFALVGLYVGVLPVLLGLAWYPVVTRLGRRGMDFVLALTLGLLLFLLVDAAHDGLEVAAEMPGSYQGVVLFALAAALAYLAIEVLGGVLQRRGAADAAWATAFLVAVGIGLHNFAEGLAIGAAFALGEAALGTLLIMGFTLHNTTEGLAIVAPLAERRRGERDRVEVGEGARGGRRDSGRIPVGRLALLGLVAGAPTIAGAWLGGFVYSPVWSVVFLAVGAGAIAQVVVQIGRGMARERGVGDLVRSAPVAAGLAAGVAVMYATGMMIG